MKKIMTHPTLKPGLIIIVTNILLQNGIFYIEKKQS